MDTNELIKATKATQRLIQDTEYYRYIFKKTERIVSVVFYITHNLPDEIKDSSDAADIEQAARAAHNAILETLQARAHTADEVVRTAAHALIMLESKLRVAQVAGVIASEVLQVLVGEIDTVLRGMNKYLDEDNAFAALAGPAVTTTASGRSRSTTESSSKRESSGVQSGELERRARIKTVLEATGEATIKDISAIVSDVSEKTIQRELNSMIGDNVVKRQGERRWSRYSLV